MVLRGELETQVIIIIKVYVLFKTIFYILFIGE